MPLCRVCLCICLEINVIVSINDCCISLTSMETVGHKGSWAVNKFLVYVHCRLYYPKSALVDVEIIEKAGL